MAKRGPRGLISKRVKSLECKCSYNGSKQAGAHRFDYCVCKVSVEKGKRGTIVSPKPDLEYIIPTIFITPPAKRRR